MPEFTSADGGVFNKQQRNPNPLQNNKFSFAIKRLPEVSWSIRGATIPSIQLDVAWQNTRFNPVPHAGVGLQWEPFELQFIVDEDLNSYNELNNWMRLLSGAIDKHGYSQLRQSSPDEVGPFQGLMSDAVLSVLTNESNPNFQVFYRDAFPIYLSELRFTNNVDSPEEQVCISRFAYLYYEIIGANPEA